MHRDRWMGIGCNYGGKTLLSLVERRVSALVAADQQWARGRPDQSRRTCLFFR